MIKETTKKEYKSMIESGCIPMAFTELKKQVELLGYTLVYEHRYINSANEITYKARSYSLLHKETRLSAFNIEAPRNDNFKELQKLRRNVAVMHKEAIVEF